MGSCSGQAGVGEALAEARKGVEEERGKMEKVLWAAKEAKQRLETERETERDSARRELADLDGKLREAEAKGAKEREGVEEAAGVWRARAEQSQHRYESLVEQVLHTAPALHAPPLHTLFWWGGLGWWLFSALLCSSHDSEGE